MRHLVVASWFEGAGGDCHHDDGRLSRRDEWTRLTWHTWLISFCPDRSALPPCGKWQVWHCEQYMSQIGWLAKITFHHAIALQQVSPISLTNHAYCLWMPWSHWSKGSCCSLSLFILHQRQGDNGMWCVLESRQSGMTCSACVYVDTVHTIDKDK